MARPLRPPRDIIEFCTSDAYLGDKDYSPAQLAVLKSIYGLKMTPEELAAFTAMHEGKPPRPGGYDEASLGFGRGSGKGDKIGAPIVAYEATRFNPEHLAPGEIAYAIMIAQNEKQAMIVRNFAEAKLRILDKKMAPLGFPIFEELPAQSKAVTAEVIRLANRVHVACFPCKKVAARGLRTIVVVFDEFGHWQLEELAYNADKEIMRAVRPTRTHFRSRGYKVPLIKISTPFDEIGEFYNDYTTRHSTRQLVLHEVPTRFLNPTTSEEELANERLRDPEAFDREYLAKWGSGADNKPFPASMVQGCTDIGRTSHAPASHEYVARIDAAFKRDFFPLGIGHLETETVIVDLIRTWKPKPQRPLDEDEVVSEQVDILRSYGIDRVIGDQFCDVPLKNRYAAHGITFQEKPVTESSKFLEYRNLISVMTSKRVRLPDDEDMRRDFSGLRKKGKTISAPKQVGKHDDISTVIRGIVFDLLPMITRVDLGKLNAEAMPRGSSAHERDRLRPPSEEDGLPTNFMEAQF